jgi:hypothetical protein
LLRLVYARSAQRYHPLEARARDPADLRPDVMTGDTEGSAPGQVPDGAGARKAWRRGKILMRGVVCAPYADAIQNQARCVTRGCRLPRLGLWRASGEEGCWSASLARLGPLLPEEREWRSLGLV